MLCRRSEFVALGPVPFLPTDDGTRALSVKIVQVKVPTRKPPQPLP